MKTFEPSLLAVETERLRLRPLNAADEALYHDIYTDPETMRFIAPPLSTEDAASSFRKVVALQHEPKLASRFMVIEEKSALQPVGICGTSKYDANAFRVEVGLILRNGGRSRGFAQEALTALIKRIFVVSPVEEIWSQFSAENSSAVQLVKRVQFRPRGGATVVEGTLLKCVWSVCRSWYVNQAINSNQ